MMDAVPTENVHANASQNSHMSILEDREEDDNVCMGESQESFTQHEMSQNCGELTQLGPDDDDSSLHPPPHECNSPLTPIDPLTIPWGRLLPQNNRSKPFDMTPRSPSPACATRSKSPSLERGRRSPTPPSSQPLFMGLRNLSPSDRFNEYVLGRSAKADVTAEKIILEPVNDDDNDDDEPTRQKRIMKQKQHDYAHSSISNRHCRIFCLLQQQPPPHDHYPPANGEMEVYVEDTSGNGTLINNSILLRKNERRKLHTGDVLCLVNPSVIARRIRSVTERKAYAMHYSYVFINLHEQEPTVPWSARGKGAVNVRATKCHSANGRRHLGSRRDIFESAKAGRAERSRGERDGIGAFLDDPARPARYRRIEEEYDLRDLLGKGTCGEVRRAIHRRTGEERAVKIIAIGGRHSHVRRFTEEKLDAILAEAEILRGLDHPYVVKLYDVYVSPGNAIYLVMELVRGGDLFDRIVERRRYTERQARRVMRRILAAVHYLHEERGIVHRDLKPENILVVDRRSDVDVKLTDFGVAKNMTAEGLKTFCGTPQYFAPEVLRRCDTVMGLGRYGKEIDCWSIGVILFILLSGSPPFDVSAGFDAVADARVEFYEDQWKDVSSEARDLVVRLLEKDPAKRMSVKKACEHAWVLKEDGDTHCHPLLDPVISKRDSNTASESMKSLEEDTTTKDGEIFADVDDRSAQGLCQSLEDAKTKGSEGFHANHTSAIHQATLHSTNCTDQTGLNSAPAESSASTREGKVNNQNGNRHLSILPYENGKSVTKIISQAMVVSLKSPNSGSPIQRKILFTKDALSKESSRKMSKANAESIKSAGVSLPKPILQTASQSPKKKKKKGINSYFTAASAITKNPEGRSTQQAISNKAISEKKRKMDSCAVTPPTAEHLVFSLKKKIKVDVKHHKSETNISPDCRENIDVPTTSKAELSEDELQSDFSDNEEGINSGNPHNNYKGTAIHKAMQHLPYTAKHIHTTQQLMATNKVTNITSKTMSNKPESRKRVQSYLFGKPPPDDKTVHTHQENTSSSPASGVNQWNDPKAPPSDPEYGETIEFQRSASTESKGAASKGNQQSIKNWFLPKRKK